MHVSNVLNITVRITITIIDLVDVVRQLVIVVVSLLQVLMRLTNQEIQWNLFCEVHFNPLKVY